MASTPHPWLRQRALGGGIAAAVSVVFWITFHITPVTEMYLPAFVGFVFGALATPGARGRPRADFWLGVAAVVVLFLNVVFFVAMVLHGGE